MAEVSSDPPTAESGAGFTLGTSDVISRDQEVDIDYTHASRMLRKLRSRAIFSRKQDPGVPRASASACSF